MKEKIKFYLKKVILEKIEPDVFVPELAEWGHYSTNVAFVLAKLRGKKSAEVAEELIGKIKNLSNGDFEKIEMGGAGFINFWLSKKLLAGELKKILKMKEKYGRLQLGGARPQKIQVEFISANPTGPLTLANGRGGFFGDVLANVLAAAGNKVFREYYVNDAGNQVNLLGESLLAELGQKTKTPHHYQGEYIGRLAQKMKQRLLGAKNSEAAGRIAAAALLREIKKSTKKAGIKFDNWYSEFQNLRGPRGLIQKVLKILANSGFVIDKDGARWLKSSEIADEKDRVLVKSDGEPTYFLSDLAYHYDKFLKRKFDKVIDIWGADHHGYVARLKSGVKVLGINPENLVIIITQLVRLVEGGKEVRMSKRRGEFITLDELIDEIGLDAARFFFLMVSPDTHLDFDLQLAKERSVKNPVYYVQYAYVRAKSILQKAGAKSKISKIKFDSLNTVSDMNLMNKLIRFPEIISETAADYMVHRLTRYAIDLARSFHDFYEKERVIGEAEPVFAARLALVRAAAQVFKNLFGLLGISAPEKM